MTRPRSPRPRNPNQLTLDALLRLQQAHPDARHFGWTRTGRPVAVLAGGKRAPEPEPVAVAARRAA